VKAGNHNDSIEFDQVEQSIRKSTEQSAAGFSQYDGIRLRISSNRFQPLGDRIDEL
jgi:hypothetical protein